MGLESASSIRQAAAAVTVETGLRRTNDQWSDAEEYRTGWCLEQISS